MENIYNVVAYNTKGYGYPLVREGEDGWSYVPMFSKEEYAEFRKNASLCGYELRIIPPIAS